MFVVFWQNNFVQKTKAACKMWVKLKPVVNFTHILKAAFEEISFCQKNTNTNCKHRKDAKKISTKSY